MFYLVRLKILSCKALKILTGDKITGLTIQSFTGSLSKEDLLVKNWLNILEKLIFVIFYR